MGLPVRAQLWQFQSNIHPWAKERSLDWICEGPQSDTRKASSLPITRHQPRLHCSFRRWRFAENSTKVAWTPRLVFHTYVTWPFLHQVETHHNFTFESRNVICTSLLSITSIVETLSLILHKFRPQYCLKKTVKHLLMSQFTTSNFAIFVKTNKFARFAKTRQKNQGSFSTNSQIVLRQHYRWFQGMS